MEIKLLEVIEECKLHLDEESIVEIMHFYEYGEYEMALEGLLIEMINRKKKLDGKIAVLVQELVSYYRLREESVFEYNFKDKYDTWISL